LKTAHFLNRIIDSNTPSIKAVPPVSDFNNIYTLENPTDEEQTYIATLSTTDRTPADWSAEFRCGNTQLATADMNDTIGEIDVPANSTAEFILTLKVGSTGIWKHKDRLMLSGFQVNEEQCQNGSSRHVAVYYNR